MTNKKFFTITIVTALLTCGIIFYACNKDDVENPADEGRKAAQELCDCFSKAANTQAEEACIAESYIKYTKHRGKKEFDDAYNQALDNCGNIPHWWLGVTAAQELCDCFSAATDQMSEMACMMGLMTKYDGLFRDTKGQGGSQAFEDAFSNAFMMNCGSIPDWFICMWSPELCAE